MSKKNKQKKFKDLKASELQNLFGAQMAGNNQQAQGILSGLSALLPSGRTEQFLLGLVIGGAAAYVLSDDELRGKLMKGAMKAYASVAGTAAELKEELADAQAELEAEQNGLL